MHWLEKAFEQRDPNLIDVARDPLFNNLTPDPRFQAFLRKMNLPVEPASENLQ